MSDLLDNEQKPIGTTRYRQWSFRFLMYTIVLNIFVFYDVSQGYIVGWRIALMSILTAIFWLAGIILTVLSHVKNERRDYQYYVSVWGFLIFTILTIVLWIVPNLLMVFSGASE